MPPIQFESSRSTFRILNPFNNFVEEEHLVEVRKDPLLGHTSVYNPYLRDKAKIFFGENNPDLIAQLGQGGGPGCIFCREKVSIATARYPDSILDGGRLVEGDAVLFANLFSIGKYHPVVSLSGSHFLRLSEFTPGILRDGLAVARRFLGIVYENDSAVSNAVVSMNYLFPAGASLVHPHLQMIVTPMPYTFHDRLLDAASAYRRRHGRSYFHDLLETERELGLRFAASTGGWHWLTAYSPLGSNEICAFHNHEGDFRNLSDADLSGLASGIAGCLRFYEGLGHLSFNFSVFSVRDASAGTGVPCSVRIVTRQNLYPNYRNDDYFLQKLLNTELIINLPEEMAPRLRDALS